LKRLGNTSQPTQRKEITVGDSLRRERFVMPGDLEKFKAWRFKHPNGFVLNEKEDEPWKLHKSTCGDLNKYVPEHVQNPKSCDESRDDLEAYAGERLGDPCGNCLRTAEIPDPLPRGRTR
jgi:hypothetical protein